MAAGSRQPTPRDGPRLRLVWRLCDFPSLYAAEIAPHWPRFRKTQLSADTWKRFTGAKRSFAAARCPQRTPGEFRSTAGCLALTVATGRPAGQTSGQRFAGRERISRAKTENQTDNQSNTPIFSEKTKMVATAEPRSKMSPDDLIDQAYYELIDNGGIARILFASAGLVSATIRNAAGRLAVDRILALTSIARGNQTCTNTAGWP